MAKRLHGYQRWTAADISHLERLYPNGGVTTLMRLLGRTKKEILQKAKRLGISYANPEDYIRVSSLAIETLGGVTSQSLRIIVKREAAESGYKKIGNYILVRKRYAEEVVERYRVVGVARRLAENNSSGFLDLSAAAKQLGVGMRTISEYLGKRRPRNSPAYLVISKLRCTRGTNKYLRFNPFDVEAARREIIALTEQRKRGVE